MDLTSLIPGFGGTLWTVFFFILALSIVVAVHEYGHYIIGRWSGIFAEVFSVGFGPVLISRIDRRGTKWQIAAIPFGGYVRFRGDAGPAGGIDGKAMVGGDARSTMHGAPLWARTATVAAGPLFNFALSVVLFAAVFMLRGVASDPLVVDQLRPVPYVQELQAGDRILEINAERLPSLEDGPAYNAFMQGLPFEAVLDYTVERGDARLTVSGPYFHAPIVGGIQPRSAAMDAGLRSGDVILQVNEQEIFAFSQLAEVIEKGQGAPVSLGIWRGGETLSLELTPRRMDEPLSEGGFRTVYRIGIASGMLFEPASHSPGLMLSLWGGTLRVWDVITGSLSGLYHMITGQISSCNLSGPVGIAQASGDMASQGALAFISFVALISTAIGLINLFPIPALDGGHLVFYAYEALRGRPPSDAALNILMTFGIALVLGLMLFGLSNDILLCRP